MLICCLLLLLLHTDAVWVCVTFLCFAVRIGFGFVCSCVLLVCCGYEGVGCIVVLGFYELCYF